MQLSQNERKPQALLNSREKKEMWYHLLSTQPLHLRAQQEGVSGVTYAHFMVKDKTLYKNITLSVKEQGRNL